MGPRVPFAPALLTLSLFTYFFISFWLFNLLYLTCVMVNKAVKKKKKKKKGECSYHCTIPALPKYYQSYHEL